MKSAKIALLVVAILWGSAFAFQKGLFEEIHPVLLTFYNFIATAFIFLAYALYKRYSLFYRWKEGVVLGLLLAVMEIFQMFGLQLSSAANSAFISNLGMLVIPYLGWVIYRHRVKDYDKFAILAAGIGMYFLVGGLDGFVVGDVALLISALVMGLYFLFSERFEGEKGSYMSVLCLQQFFVTSLVCAIYLFTTKGTFTVTSDFIPTLTWQVLVFTTFPYALIQWASKYSDEMIVTMYDGVAEPLVGGIVAWGLFAEATSLPQVLGGLLMVLSFGVSVIYSNKHAFIKKYILINSSWKKI